MLIVKLKSTTELNFQLLRYIPNRVLHTSCEILMCLTSKPRANKLSLIYDNLPLPIHSTFKLLKYYLTVIPRGLAGYELIYITNEASPRRITDLVNFQAILLIFTGEASSNRDIFFTQDAA